MHYLICTNCKKEFDSHEPVWRCECGGLLDLKMKFIFNPNEISNRRKNIWRYREALPINDDMSIVSLDEGFTPLTSVDFNSKKVFIKQDHLFPSGSYKDRGAAVQISKVKELQIKKVVEDSSGNAGCAVAAYCAKGNIECDIYVPASSSEGKLVQIKAYGANLVKIPGTRKDCADTVLNAAEKFYYASHSYNPYFFHGTKTFAYEVCEQLNWRAPDAVILPVGNGTLLLGCQIGFRELFELGIINKIPKLIGVQSAGCDPLAKMFNENISFVPEIENHNTIAEGIAIVNPVRGNQIVDAIKESGGFFITVHDEEIISSLKEIFSLGFYIEPTSAATIAGVKQYLTQSNDATIVSAFTGHGLKATEKILKLI